MTKEVITIPDLGGVSDAEIVEVSVAIGDDVAVDDTLLVLESDKASMEIPSPYAGKLLSLDLKVGDSVVAGDSFGSIAVGSAEVDHHGGPVRAPESAAAAPPEPAVAAPLPAAVAGSDVIEVRVPDLGGAAEVEVIELPVKPGDQVTEGDTYMVLESDKASMEVPCPLSGTVVDVRITVGDVLSEGAGVMTLEVAAVADHPAAEATALPPATPASLAARQEPSPKVQSASPQAAGAGRQVHAGPAVRKLAREFGVELDRLAGTGPQHRILKEDVQAYVKGRLRAAPEASGVAITGIPALAQVDFSQFGPVRIEPMTKLHKLTAANMHRSWLNVPRVTQFDEADITELEKFRAELKAEAPAPKVTPMPFLLKACAVALLNNPAFNASLHGDGEQIVYKGYVHIGMAVATPAGLMVPVIRDVDKKSVYQLAAESLELAQKAKDRALKPQEMQGGCFTISSLGNIGGTGFTPVINAPEVAILGVSRLSVKPVWDGTQFEPRKMLPLALAYDHRAVNGADAGKFLTELVASLSDIRRLLL